MTRLLSALLAAIICYVSSPLMAGDFIKPTAKLERDLSGKIRLSIQFAKLSSSDLSSLEIKPSDKSTLNKALIRYLDICVVTSGECGASVLKAKYVQDPLIDKTPTIDQSTSLEAEVDGSSILFQQDLNATTYSLTADILLRTSDSNAAFSSSTKIATRVVFGSPVITDNKTDIPVSYGLGVSDALKDPYLVSSKRALTAAWTQSTSVSLSDGSQGSATGVLAVLIPKTFIDSASSLPSRIYNADYTKQSAIADSTCTVTLTDDGKGCSLGCTDESNRPQFLKLEDLETLQAEGIKTELIGNSAGNAITFTDLDPSDTYAILLQYVPDGTKRSCLIGQASDAITLIQIETGEEPKVGSSNCFIATAAYGSPLHHHLRSLRWFRDQHLMTYSWGQRLVRTYYEYGPQAAAWISEKPLLRSIVRGFLWIPVTLIEHSEAYRSATNAHTN